MKNLTFEKVTAFADKFADAADENTVNGELHWIFTEIVSGGENEMYTADGVEDLLNACERNEFGENAELVEAAGIARTMLND